MVRSTIWVGRRWARLALCVSLAILAVTAARPASAASTSSDWPMFGQNYANTASNASETYISTQNVKNLKPKWVFTTGGDVSARAAVVGGVAYFPDWGGNLWAVNAGTGKLIWQKTLLSFFSASDFTGGTLPSKVVARSSPAVDANGNLYIGTQQGAYLLSIDTKDGTLHWKTQLDPHPLAIITASAAVYNGVVYEGVASLEEGAAANPNYPCCSFRGSAVAVNAATGAIQWKTYMAPSGYTGDSVWGSNPVVDVSRSTIFVGTGNNYTTPTDPAYTACIQGGGTENSCLSPDDHVDSVVALDMTTGAIKWSRRLSTGDDWTVACIAGFNPGTGNCPTGSGPDYDFGSAPNEFTIQTKNGPKTVIGAGQKSGVYSAFDPDTGQLLWATQVGPGSSLGGIEWGSATDGTRIYVAISNLGHQPYSLSDPFASTVGTAGSFSALDPATGKILWQVPDPNNTVDIGPMAVANGVVYAPSMGGSSTAQNMLALNAATGQTLWSYAAGGSVNAGAVIAKSVVYWGSGYSNLPIPGFTGNNKFYAFSVGGQ